MEFLKSKHLNNLIHTIIGQKQHEWSYEGECGPQTWSKTFSGARGNHQSPINIETRSTKFNQDLLNQPLKIEYDDKSCFQIKNTGHTFQVDGFQENSSKIRDGPVNHSYNFLQFHMHWGDSLDKGSEHLINGHAYSAELHFVNWNHEQYKDPKHASDSNKNDGLLVLAVFVKIGEHNAEFDNLTKYIDDIHLKDHHVPVTNINLNNLLPKNTISYWTYPGSLTTPPCNECVQWIVFKHPIEISADQIEKCHHLYHVSKEKLCNDNVSIKYNDRPVCSMGDRVVYRSFH